MVKDKSSFSQISEIVSPESPEQVEAQALEDDGGVTLMMCNIPCRLSYNAVINLLHEAGVYGNCDFVHLPRRKNQKKANLGYAFVHFRETSAAARFGAFFNGYRFLGTGSSKVGSVKTAHIQGLLDPGEDADDQWLYLHTGERLPFQCKQGRNA